MNTSHATTFTAIVMPESSLARDSPSTIGRIAASTMARWV